MAPIINPPTPLETRVVRTGDINKRIASSEAALLRSREVLAETAGMVERRSEPR